MHCPACGSTKLRIGVVFSGAVVCEFRNGSVVEVLESTPLDSAWDADSPSECLACRWSGRMADLRSPATLVSSASPALTEAELNALEQDLERGRCPRRLEGAIVKVLTGVRRLQVQLRILERLHRQSQRSPRPLRSGDTALA